MDECGLHQPPALTIWHVQLPLAGTGHCFPSYISTAFGVFRKQLLCSHFKSQIKKLKSKQIKSFDFIFYILYHSNI